MSFTCYGDAYTVLHWSFGVSFVDHINNVTVQQQMSVASIIEKMNEDAIPIVYGNVLEQQRIALLHCLPL